MKSHIEITDEEIEYYYNELNHSQKECADHFNMSVGIFIKTLKERGIHKDQAKHVEKIKQSKKERYGDENYNNRELAKATCVEKYGVDNPFKDIEKIRSSYVEKLGVDHPMRRDDIKNRVIEKHNYDEIWDKAHETYKEKTGYDNPGKNPDAIKKMLKSKVANGCYDSPGTSNLEVRLERILNRKFQTVVSKYRDERYSRDTGYQYECDFYIPELDLFIELNAHPSHFNEPYDCNNESHRILAEKYRDSDKLWDRQTYNTWVVRDAEKIKCARENNLNYVVLYPTNSICNNKKMNDKKYSDLIEYLIKKLNKKE